MILRPDILIKAHIRTEYAVHELHLRPEWDGCLWKFYGEFETHWTDSFVPGQLIPIIECLDVEGCVCVLHFRDDVLTGIKSIKVKSYRVDWISERLRTALSNPEKVFYYDTH